ncbi:MAG: GAF domain-containing protein [Pseudoflavonifractor sp.]|nr:GAF domain-containing protein [Alloprevotella sp.]MCM1117441.1 GAF domain-containing protein [Pseudoflavonifractor sp.]
MSENLIISGSTKEERYASLLPQIETMTLHEPDPIALMANISAAIMATLSPLWAGFYRVIGPQLVLGPFQGPLACTRIPHGKGVCGSAWAEDKTLVVADVELFPGHIACSSASRSEIVVPFHRGAEVAGVLDIDSSSLAAFDSTDALWLEKAMALFSAALGNGPL